MLRIILVPAIALVTISTNARAEANFFELTPYAAASFGGTFTEGETGASANLDDSGSFGLILNFRESSNTQWEILYSQQSTEVKASGLPEGDQFLDIDVQYLHGGGTYQGSGDKVRPYLAATIGGTRFDVKDEGFGDDTFFSFSIGTGLQIRPNERFGLRLEVRAFGTLIKSDSTLFCVSDPGSEVAGCAFAMEGEVLWQLQTMAGIVFRF